MGSQQSSCLKANRNSTPIKQTTTELDFIFKRSIFWRPTYIAQSAWLEHIPFAFWLVDTLQPRKIVELGSHYGSSYFSFCQAVAKLDLDTKCYAVDTWGGDVHAGQYGEEVYQQVSEHNQQHYSDFSSLVRSTFDQALEHFPQSSIDLLHIDGLHTLDAVRHDFESWLPKLSDRAVVIMHDTNVRERGFGVFQLMDELKQQYPHFEFAHGHGLGVIGVGSQQSHEMLSLYDLTGNASATRQVQEVFSRLGKACGYSWENNVVKRQMAALQENQQAETQELTEQNALERGRLAERITAHHHELKKMEEELAYRADQVEELTRQQQQISALTSDVAELTQQASNMQSALTQCEQQRDQSLIKQEELGAEIKETQQTLALTVTERDLIINHKQSLFEQYTELQEMQSALQQQLHEQALHLNEETQRVAELTLALNKSNEVLNEYSYQLSAKQQQIDEQAAALAAAYQQQDELSQTLASEAAQWHQQKHALAETQSQLQIMCDELKGDLEKNSDEIANLNQALIENAETIDKQGVDLADKCNQLEVVQEQLSYLTVNLNERVTEIVTLTGWLEESEREAVKSASELRQATQEHHIYQQEWLTEHVQLCSNAEQSIQRQAELNQQVIELVKYNKELETNIAERFRELAIMTNLVEKQARELKKGEDQTEQLKSRISKLKSTISWRVTAPVRALAKPFKESPRYSISQVNTIANSGLFDEQWYLQQYPDVLATSSAIEHYLNFGAKNSYNPSQKFDTAWYLNMYPDVASGEMNPLLHYILHGQHEGRQCRS